MEKETMQESILQEMKLLLEKTCIEAFAPLLVDAQPVIQDEAAILVNLKSINARYDKHEAIAQVKAIMETYNIQIDELLEKVHH